MLQALGHSITGVLVLTGLYWGVQIATDHLGSGWDPHAKWHAAVGGVYVSVTAIGILLTTWRSDAGQFATRAWLVLMLPVGMLIAMLIVQNGAPQELWLAGAAFVGALAIVGIDWVQRKKS